MPTQLLPVFENLPSSATCFNPIWFCFELQGKHLHTVWADFGDEMARVEGAVVVRRPGIAGASGRIAPAHTLDFVATLQSYFAVFRSSLLPRYGQQT